MTKIITFGEIPDNLAPYTRLQKVIDQERFESDRAKLQESEPVDKSLLIDDQTTSRKETHSLRESHALKKAASLKEGVQSDSLKEGPSLKEVHPQREIDDGLVMIVNNYCFFDRDLFRFFSELKEGELRIYLGLYIRSYAMKHPKNICSCTNAELSKTTGITSSSAFSRAFKGLESKGLIKRLITSRSLNEKSLFRVFLPCEIRGIKSSTEVKYLTEDEWASLREARARKEALL